MSTPETVSLETTHHVRDHCLCLATQRAARALARRFDLALQPLDLTSGQFSLLMSLNRPQAPSITSVAGMLAMDRTTLTANLKPLVRRGLVVMTVDPKDRRGRLLAITDAGRTLLVKAVPVWERTHAETELKLTGCDTAMLRTGLAALA